MIALGSLYSLMVRTLPLDRNGRDGRNVGFNSALGAVFLLVFTTRLEANKFACSMVYEY